jgi:hypothetical protein
MTSPENPPPGAPAQRPLSFHVRRAPPRWRPVVVESDSEDEEPLPPLPSALSRGPDDPPRPGRLCLARDQLIFESDALHTAPLVFPLLEHVESEVVPDWAPARCNPDADTCASLLLFTHLRDFAIETLYFSGTKSELARFRDAIQAAAQLAQRQRRVSLPDVNRLPVWSPRRQISLPHLVMQGDSQVLDPPQFAQLRMSVPPRFRRGRWRLLYQLSRDGSSLATLFQKAEGAEPIVIALKTCEGEQLGAYVSDGLRRSRRYYGRGETFVYKFSVAFEVFWAKQGGNQFFIAGSSDELAIGGGGASAIWIGEGMEFGYSDACSTFASPALARQPGERFRIADLEAWTITHL